MDNFCFTVDNTSENIRLDKWLLEHELNITRSMIQKLIAEGEVTVNGKAVSKNYITKKLDLITVNVPEPKAMDVKAQNLPIEIVYQDNDLLVVNKPKGMVVHPSAGNYDGTLVNALLFHCQGQLSSINGVIRPGIVHRIDKNTSGLLIVAKTDMAHLGLAEQIKAHTFTREYEAIVCGRMKEQEGTINLPIGRNLFDRKKMCVTDKNSKNAVTNFFVIENFDKFSHLRIKLETGRTHQIRVHMSYIGHPVLGDDVYGKQFKGLQGQCLHAKKIGFVHPRTHEYLEFDSELPEYFIEMLRKVQ